MPSNIKTRTILTKCVAGAAIISLSGLNGVGHVRAFTRVEAEDLNRRLAHLNSRHTGGGENLFTVAEEMDRILGSSFGPVPMKFSDTLQLRLVGSFGEGEDYASLDVLSCKDVGYGSMLEGGLPLFTFQKDWNPGIFANFGYSAENGINLNGRQFAEMMGSAPIALGSYVLGGFLVAATGLAVYAHATDDSTDTSPPSSELPSSKVPFSEVPSSAESQTQTSQSQEATSPSSAINVQTPREPQVVEQAQTVVDTVAGDGGSTGKKDKSDKSNNRDGDKNQPSGTAGGFKHNK